MQEIITLTKDLIRFKSTQSRPEEIGRCVDFIQDYLDAGEIAFERVDNDGTPSILVLPAPDFAPVLLMSHIDVVEGAAAQFEPFEKDGRLYGRGSIDDKYAVALSLVLLKNRIQQCRREGLGQEDLPFGVLITGDEEVGGYSGAKAVLARVRTGFCIALDGGSPNKIVVKEKGILKLKLVASGKAAHAARPWLGENAIENLISDYGIIKSFFEPPLPPVPEHWHRTLNFSIVRAGRSHNQVPDTAEARFDVRYTEADDVDTLVADIQAAISGELIVENVEPVFASRPSPHLDRLAQVAEGAVFSSEHGASDARHLLTYGMNGVVWGADGELSQHSAEEHVVIDSVGTLYRRIDRFVA